MAQRFLALHRLKGRWRKWTPRPRATKFMPSNLVMTVISWTLLRCRYIRWRSSWGHTVSCAWPLRSSPSLWPSFLDTILRNKWVIFIHCQGCLRLIFSNMKLFHYSFIFLFSFYSSYSFSSCSSCPACRSCSCSFSPCESSSWSRVPCAPSLDPAAFLPAVPKSVASSSEDLRSSRPWPLAPRGRTGHSLPDAAP